MSRSVVDQIQIVGVGWSLDPVSTYFRLSQRQVSLWRPRLSWRVLPDDIHPVLYSQTFLLFLLIYRKGDDVNITQKF